MTGHARWLILGCAAVVLIGAHMLPLYYLVAHKGLTAGVAGGVLLLVVAKHLGLFGPLFGFLRGGLRKLRK